MNWFLRLQEPVRTVIYLVNKAKPGAHGDWHLVRRSPHKCACPHVRLCGFEQFIQPIIELRVMLNNLDQTGA